MFEVENNDYQITLENERTTTSINIGIMKEQENAKEIERLSKVYNALKAGSTALGFRTRMIVCKENECPICKSEINKTNYFCPKCGQALKHMEGN